MLPLPMSDEVFVDPFELDESSRFGGNLSRVVSRQSVDLEVSEGEVARHEGGWGAGAIRQKYSMANTYRTHELVRGAGALHECLRAADIGGDAGASGGGAWAAECGEREGEESLRV